jgi:hypothetical protein
VSAAQAAAGAAATVRAHVGWTSPAPDGSRAALILLCGLPGTGKSYLASAIASRHDVLVVRSDEVRKILYPRPRYSASENGFVYLTCYALLEALLRDRHAIVFDATNLLRDGRKRAQQLAEAAGAPFLTLLTTAPDDVVAARLASRAAGNVETFSSDADWAVHQKLATTAEPLNEPGLVVDTSHSIEPALAAVDKVLGGRT